MSKIEPQIKSYIDESIKVASKAFGDEIRGDISQYSKESKQHMTDLVGHLDDRIKEIERVASSLPSEWRVREIVQEEIKPTNDYMRIALTEIRDLRIDVNGHEKRITKLEDFQLA
jgi:hypothetical protein